MACILLVEDEAEIRFMLAEVLVHAGHRVVEADSGDAAALLLTTRDDFDLFSHRRHHAWTVGWHRAGTTISGAARPPANIVHHGTARCIAEGPVAAQPRSSLVQAVRVADAGHDRACDVGRRIGRGRLMSRHSQLTACRSVNSREPYRQLET